MIMLVSKVPLIILANQHNLANAVADEAGHQHPMYQHGKFPAQHLSLSPVQSAS